MLTRLKRHFWKITTALLLIICAALTFILVKNSLQSTRKNEEQKYTVLKEKFILLAQAQENLYEILLSSQRKLPDVSLIGQPDDNRAKLVKLQNLLNDIRKNQSNLSLSDLKSTYINIAREQIRIFQLFIDEKEDIDFYFNWDFSNCLKQDFSKMEERNIPEDPFRDYLDKKAKDDYTNQRRKSIFYEDVNRWITELNQNIEELQKEK